MERRGSGLTRIVESYNDYNVKPTFSSDVSSFKVIFPNKSYIEKVQLRAKKVRLQVEILLAMKIILLLNYIKIFL